MKTQNGSAEVQNATIRAGVISLLVPTVCYLWMTPLTDVRAWLLMISTAVCFVLMMTSIVDLLVLAFGLAAKFSGMGVGRATRLVRRYLSHRVKWA